MNKKSKFRIVLITIFSTLLLTQCKDDDAPADYCDKHWTLNQDYLENLLFDYENTDTLLYKRTMNNVVTDTLMFIKKQSYQDILLFSNNEAAGDPNCGNNEFTRERIGWDYSSQYDSIFFNVQVVASGEGVGNDAFIVEFKDDHYPNYLLGAYIGNYGANHLTSYATSEDVFQYVWYGDTQSDYVIDGTGVREYIYTKQLEWKTYYHIDNGIIEISKTDRTEVWELIL
jgi:hypothetical protein